jgi:hypothetical protein
MLRRAPGATSQLVVETQGAETVSKHTPGPWRLVNTSSGNPILIYAENGKYLALSHHGGNVGWKPITDLDEAKANARLMAAAPELLEALKAFLEDTLAPVNTLAMMRAEAIIAKAEGAEKL